MHNVPFPFPVINLYSAGNRKKNASSLFSFRASDGFVWHAIIPLRVDAELQRFHQRHLHYCFAFKLSPAIMIPSLDYIDDELATTTIDERPILPLPHDMVRATALTVSKRHNESLVLGDFSAMFAWHETLISMQRTCKDWKLAVDGSRVWTIVVRGLLAAWTTRLIIPKTIGFVSAKPASLESLEKWKKVKNFMPLFGKPHPPISRVERPRYNCNFWRSVEASVERDVAVDATSRWLHADLEIRLNVTPNSNLLKQYGSVDDLPKSVKLERLLLVDDAQLVRGKRSGLSVTRTKFRPVRSWFALRTEAEDVGVFVMSPKVRRHEYLQTRRRSVALMRRRFLALREIKTKICCRKLPWEYDDKEILKVRSGIINDLNQACRLMDNIDCVSRGVDENLLHEFVTGVKRTPQWTDTRSNKRLKSSSTKRFVIDLTKPLADSANQ